VRGPSPTELIAAQERANRINTTGPGGTQTYGRDANGQTTFTTELSPQMQALFDRSMGMAGQDSERYNKPQGFDELVASMMSRVSARPAGRAPRPARTPRGN